jgi:hypothetical protein
MSTHRRTDLHALVKTSLVLSVAALPFGAALGGTPTAADRELAVLRARYAAVLARMQDLDQRTQEVDQLIARAVTLDSMRARGVAEQAEQSATRSKASCRTCRA